MFLLLALAALAFGPAGAAEHALERISEARPKLADVSASLARGRYSEAEVTARGLLEYARSTSGESSLAAAEARDLLLEVLLTEGLAGTRETLELAEAALSIKERIVGTEDPGYGWTLALAGVVDSNAANGHAMLERALAIQEAAPDAAPSRIAWTLFHVGWWRNNCPETRKGAASYHRAWSMSERALGRTHPDTLRAWAADLVNGDPSVCLDSLAAAIEGLKREGRGGDPVAALLWRSVAHCHGINPHSEYAAILDALERALEIDLQALGPDSLHVAEDHLDLTLRLSAKGEFAAADAHLESATAAFEKAFDAGSPRMLPLVAVKARHALSADREEAGELLRQALALRTAVFGQECPIHLQLLFDYANWLRGRGECPQAREILEQTLELVQEHESPELPWCLHHLGEAVACMGDTPRAVAYLEQSLAEWERLVPPDALTLWVVLVDLGDFNSRLGNHEVAEGYLQRSIALQERHLGPRYLGIGTALTFLGRSYVAREQWPRARDVLERALSITEEAFGKSGTRTEHVLRELCSVHLALGELEQAQRVCERGFTIVTDRQGIGHPYHAQAAARLASVLLARGQREEALARAVRAEDSARGYLLRTTRRLSEREALGLKDMEAHRQPGLDVALSIVAGGEPPGKDVSLVWDQCVRSRALVLDEMAARHTLSVAAAGPERALASQLEAARENSSRLLIRSFAPEGQVTPRQLEGAFAEVDRAERELAANDAVFAASLERTRTRLSEVLGLLPARTALVSYVKYRRMGRTAPFDWTPSYLAFVHAPGRSPAVVDLGAAERIEQLVEDWRQELETPPPPEAVLARGRSYAAAGGALREAVWDPVRARIAGADLALVVPDGALSLVSFMALPSTAGRYVVEEAPVLHLLSAERDVADLSRSAVPGSGLLIVGAPAFDLVPSAVAARERLMLSSLVEPPTGRPVYRGASPCEGLVPQELQPLPRALAEIEQVAAIWSAAAQEPAAAPVIKLVEEQATEGAFKRLVAGRRVIHVATHGFVGDAGCLAQEIPQGFDPRLLTIAGLAFAGAGRRNEAGPDEEDGILTADEVASLDLTRAEWVVLSACDSGIGRGVEGEGVLGLRRAFRTAGARTLVMSLWRVQDESASQWMTRLYRARARHESTASAVRTAALELLRTRRDRGLDTHPYHWGAFVAAGDWR